LSGSATYPEPARRMPKLLAVSSGGGHFVQMLRLRPAFSGLDVVFVSVNPAYKTEVGGHRFYAINDATQWNKFGLLLMLLKIIWIMLRERPSIVISTGAAPGYFALRIGRMLGARTIWLDSIANVETLSLSGKLVGPYADLWLTQWAHLAKPGGPQYEGAVL
jgi:UDP-N-acetylglucosamine:LPS N-acetylglucosamine transferase